MALKVATAMEGSAETLTPFPLSEELGYLSPWQSLVARLSRELCTFVLCMVLDSKIKCR